LREVELQTSWSFSTAWIGGMYESDMEWKWKDGAEMNMTLINENLVEILDSNVDDRMAILNTNYGSLHSFGISDLNEYYNKYHFVCKIYCPQSTTTTSTTTSTSSTTLTSTTTSTSTTTTTSTISSTSTISTTTTTTITTGESQCESYQCSHDCITSIGKEKKRFYFYSGSMYYFNKDEKSISWEQAEEACNALSTLTRHYWPGQPIHLTSLKDKEEFDFLVNKLESFRSDEGYRAVHNHIGGKLVGSNWIWTDGMLMNKTLIYGPDKLWTTYEEYDNPSGNGETAMEMVTDWKIGLNDISETFVYKDRTAYICKIPCPKVIWDREMVGGTKDDNLPVWSSWA